MEETELKEILNHQLEGIMFHSEMIDLFIVLKLPKLQKIQEHQLWEEVRNHIMTKYDILKKYGKLITGEASNSKIIPNMIKETPFDVEGRNSIAKNAIAAWNDWEHKTVDIYRRAYENEKSCKLWKTLLQCAEKEIKMIERLKKRV